MARERRRKRPRDSIDTNEKQPAKKADMLLWALGVGIFLGLLGFIVGITNNIRDAIVLAIVGFALGSFGGAISVAGIRWPRNKDMTDYKGDIPGWGPHGKYYENPLLERMAEEEYRMKYKNSDDDDEDE